jgi:hypothetical protein
MLAGKRFRLVENTLASEVVDGRRISICIPTGTIITVVSDPTDSGFVDVLWESRPVAMFRFDVQQVGEEISD